MRTLVLILAGGAGGRMDLLTERRAKPVLPFGGVYRLIDFPLSNCQHSGIEDVWIVQQYEPQSLNDHLANGRPWDLDRTYGGLRLLTPQQGGPESGWHQGNADALYKNRAFVKEFDPGVLLVLSADHVYKLDYREVVAFHQEHDADVTIVTTKVPKDEASRFATVESDEDGRVTGFQYKPDEPPTEVVSTEVFAYRPGPLLDLLEELGDEKGNGDDLPEDYGESLLPSLVERGKAWRYAFDGYWRDVGTVESYWKAHQDLLTHTEGPGLHDPLWPILTLAPQRPPARFAASSELDDAVVSPGCTIHGTVVRSVLGPGVVVERGATVRDCVVFEDCTIEPGAVVDAAIVDCGARIEQDAVVSQEGSGARGSDGIVLIGQGATVEAGSRVAPGERIRT